MKTLKTSTHESEYMEGDMGRLRYYKGWIITPIKADTMIAQKDRHVLQGEYEEIIVAIETYEKTRTREEKKHGRAH